MGVQPGELPKVLNQRAAIRLLTAAGWTRSRGGKHVGKMRRPGRRPITPPHHSGDDYGTGLTRAIYRQAGMVDEDG